MQYTTENTDGTIRCAVATNPSTPEAIKASLASDPDVAWLVRDAEECATEEQAAIEESFHP